MAEEMGINAKVSLDSTGFRTGISEINRQLKVAKEEFGLASAKLGSFANSSETGKVKVEGLTRQIDLQHQKVAALVEGYDKSVASKGKDAKATENLQIELLKAQRQEANMASEIQKVNKDAEKQTTIWGKLSKASGESTGRLSAGIGNAKGALIGLAAIATGGAGLYAVTNSAIEAGNATYILSEKLGVTTTEAAGMSRIFKITDTDTKPFISTMLRLDKAVETAGKKGNATTKSLAEFGVKITDAHGKLLPMPQQLDKLAEGYQKAAEAGNEEAFVAQVLGTKGQALIPVLANYTEAKEQASKIKGIGIDPKMAHETEESLKALKMQIGQIGLTFASALLPIVNQIIPPLMTAFSSLAEFIKAHSAEMKGSISKFGAELKDVLTHALPLLKSMFTFISSHGKVVKDVLIGIGLAFGSFKVVTGIIRGITSAQKLWEEATNALKVAHAALNLVMKMNPIGLIIIAIAALVVGLVILFNHNKAFHDFVIKSWEVIKTTIGGAITSSIEFLKSLGDTVLGAWNVMRPVLIDGIKEIQIFWKAVWPQIQQVFKEVWVAMQVLLGPTITFLYVAISTGLGFIKGAWSSAWKLIKDTFKIVWDGITGNLKISWDLISGIIKVALDLLTGNFKGAGRDFLGIFTNIGRDIKSFFGNMVNDAVNWGGDLINGLINGIKGAVGGMVDAVKGVADTIKSFLHFSVPDEGPLTDYESWMPDFMGGLAQGITKNKGKVTNAIKSLSTDMSVGVKYNSASAVAGATNASNKNSNPSNTIINFNGSYNFNNKQDIDYFMNNAALLIQRRKV